jgi:hypothetical protein
MPCAQEIVQSFFLRRTKATQINVEFFRTVPMPASDGNKESDMTIDDGRNPIELDSRLVRSTLSWPENPGGKQFVFDWRFHIHDVSMAQSPIAGTSSLIAASESLPSISLVPVHGVSPLDELSSFLIISVFHEVIGQTPELWSS